MDDKFSLQITDLYGVTQNSKLVIENNLSLEKNYQADIKQSGSVTVYGDAIPINAWLNYRVYLYKNDFIDYRKDISQADEQLRFSKKDTNVYEVTFDSRDFFNSQDIIHVQINVEKNTSASLNPESYSFEWSDGTTLETENSSDIPGSGISIFLKPAAQNTGKTSVYGVNSLTLYSGLDEYNSITSVYIEFLKRPEKLGTFIPYTDKAVFHDDKLYSQTLSLYDCTMITKYTQVISDEVLPAGMSMYTVLNKYLEQASVSFSDQTNIEELKRKKLSSDLQIKAGKSIQSVLNSICDMFNYFSPWCDQDGNFVFTPYTNPNSRPVSINLLGSNFHYNKNIELTTQGLISNRVTVKSKSTEQQDSFSAISINTNSSTYGVAYTGFYIDDYYQDVEIYDKRELFKYSSKLLENNSFKSTYSVTLYDMLLTKLQPYEKVISPFNRYATISKIKLDFKAKTTTLELSE